MLALDEVHGIDKDRDGYYPWYKRPTANQPIARWPKHYYKSGGGYPTYKQAYNVIARSRQMPTMK